MLQKNENKIKGGKIMSSIVLVNVDCSRIKNVHDRQNENLQ